MRFCCSPIALTLGAVFIALATQQYVAGPGFFGAFDSAIGVSELALFGLGLLSLRIVKKRNKGRLTCASEPLSIAWLAGTESGFEDTALTEIEYR